MISPPQWIRFCGPGRADGSSWRYAPDRSRSRTTLHSRSRSIPLSGHSATRPRARRGCACRLKPFEVAAATRVPVAAARSPLRRSRRTDRPCATPPPVRVAAVRHHRHSHAGRCTPNSGSSSANGASAHRVTRASLLFDGCGTRPRCGRAQPNGPRRPRKPHVGSCEHEKADHRPPHRRGPGTHWCRLPDHRTGDQDDRLRPSADGSAIRVRGIGPGEDRCVSCNEHNNRVKATL